MKKNKNKIKISFILAIYNAERTLEECLNSILMQDFPKNNYEIIIVDGGSTDSTLSIIKKFMKMNKNIKLIHNPEKLSEGKGMGKDKGIKASLGEFIVILDHDNIILNKSWLKQMLYPLEDNRLIACSQSLLAYTRDDTNFLKYVNAIGVEDPFAVPYSLVAQVILHPEKFKLIKNKYYLYTLKKERVLYGGANGCIFRKKIFDIINGYTRDVNVFASMSDYKMNVAIVKDAKIHHKTGTSFLEFLKKKIIYFYRFISYGYKEGKFRWVQKGFSGQARFYLTVFLNLSIIVQLFVGLKQFIKNKRFFWLLHPFYVFYMTLIYCFITFLMIRNYLKYVKGSYH